MQSNVNWLGSSVGLFLQRIIGVRTSSPRNKKTLVGEHPNHMSPVLFLRLEALDLRGYWVYVKKHFTASSTTGGETMSLKIGIVPHMWGSTGCARVKSRDHMS